MKQLLSYLLLALLACSIFFLIFIPMESYNVVQAWRWEEVEVEIIKSEVKTNRGRFYLDIERDERIQFVSVCHGDISLSIVVLRWLTNSSLYTDCDSYPVGMVTTAYRNPAGTKYLLEQNSLWLMGILFRLSLICPSFATYHIIKKS